MQAPDELVRKTAWQLVYKNGTIADARLDAMKESAMWTRAGNEAQAAFWMRVYDYLAVETAA